MIGKYPVSMKSGVYLLLLIGILLIVFPMYLTFVTVFKTPFEAADHFFSLPSSLYLDNLRTVLGMPNIWKNLLNSIGITVVATVCTIVLVPMSGYAISRSFNHWYFKGLFFKYTAGIFVPVLILMLPTMKLMSKLQLANPVGLIVIYVTAAFIQGVFLCVSYLKTIPMEMEEAASVDGCNTWVTFFKVIYPVMKPITITILIINALHIWNDFTLPYILLNKSSSNWTLPLFQYNLKARTDTGIPIQYAAYALSIFPMLLFYAFIQKYLIGGLTEGSLKT